VCCRKNRHLILFEQWLDQHLAGIQDPEHARLLCAFATWHHLRRMRKLANDGQLHNGSAHTAKQELTVATQLLAFLAARGRSPATCRQADIDAWLASGPTTRSSARTFVRWGHPQPAYPQGGLSLPNGADPPDPRPAGTTRAARRRPRR
jgi:hypothetical protein